MRFNILFLSAVLCVSSFLGAGTLHAATLMLGGSSTANIGNTITLPVLVTTSSGEPLNAVSAVVSFPVDKLSLISLSKSGSLINLWSQEPSFSNANGTATFEGVVFNPGWSGNNGTVVTLTFKIKSAGVASVTFASASVLANDGEGTNILDSASSKTLTLGEAPPPEPIEPVAPTVPVKPIVTPAASSTVEIVPVPAQVLPTEVAKERSVSEMIGEYFTPTFLALLALAFLIASFIYTMHALLGLKRRLGKRIDEAEKRVHHDFDVMRDDIVEELKGLETARSRRALTREEERIANVFRKHLFAVEEDIMKSLKETKKEVK